MALVWIGEYNPDGSRRYVDSRSVTSGGAPAGLPEPEPLSVIDAMSPAVQRQMILDRVKDRVLKDDPGLDPAYRPMTPGGKASTSLVFDRTGIAPAVAMNAKAESDPVYQAYRAKFGKGGYRLEEDAGPNDITIEADPEFTKFRKDYADQQALGKSGRKSIEEEIDDLRDEHKTLETAKQKLANARIAAKAEALTAKNPADAAAAWKKHNEILLGEQSIADQQMDKEDVIERKLGRDPAPRKRYADKDSEADAATSDASPSKSAPGTGIQEEFVVRGAPAVAVKKPNGRWAVTLNGKTKEYSAKEYRDLRKQS